MAELGAILKLVRQRDFQSAFITIVTRTRHASAVISPRFKIMTANITN